ncbi:hypothetical protein Pyn_16539 [Prunus yedoensis var. nudiflora]|uniref:Uncharacterized protein n=1 Tax=Prunus yedoensis var. nudiflora TaxID=2094558 RepID=A0A314UYZ9_PRUYE|nr:hypothetical protein Pyn_16539 [Prunus yedoensis var. nudiflora]
MSSLPPVQEPKGDIHDVQDPYPIQPPRVAKPDGKKKGKKKSKKAKKNFPENMEELHNMKEIFIQSSQDMYHLANCAQQYN